MQPLKIHDVTDKNWLLQMKTVPALAFGVT